MPRITRETTASADVETGLYVSLAIYSLALPVSMAATNFALALAAFFSVSVSIREGRKPHPPKSIFCLLLFFLWAAATDWFSSGRLSLSSLRDRKEINLQFGRGDFGTEQGAKSEHTRLYVSDEQRSHGAKAPGQIDTVILLRALNAWSFDCEGIICMVI